MAECNEIVAIYVAGVTRGVALVTLPAASTVLTSADATILAYVLTLDDSITPR